MKNKKNKTTCVMPFYNECFTSVITNVLEILKVKEIDLIVVIDDGSKSTDTYDMLVSLFENKPKVIIKRLANNCDKTSAIYQALNYVPDGTVFLCDSDLKNIANGEISSALVKYNLFNMNMLILRRIKMSFLPKIIRADTLLSGERILKKNDLITIIKSGVRDYQLEVAINQYFIKNNLKNGCFWSPSSAINNYKYQKLKFFKGIFKDLKMYFNVIKFIGFGNFTKQVFCFCKAKF